LLPSRFDLFNKSCCRLLSLFPVIAALMFDPDQSQCYALRNNFVNLIATQSAVLKVVAAANFGIPKLPEK
jgi:hypothetical protein